MTDTYRYTGTRWTRQGETVTTGDTVEPTEAELAAFGDTLVRVDGDDTDGTEAAASDAAASTGGEPDASPTGDTDDDTDADSAETDDTSDGADLPFDPTEKSVRELKSALKAGDFTADDLARLEDAERAGEERVSALNALSTITPVDEQEG